jgi:transposase
MGRIYNTEYKTEVCRRVVEGGETVAAVSREIGVNENSIHSWVKRYRQNSSQPFVGSGNTRPEDVELRRLQRENRELKEENEILKKAAAYFARNQK